MNDAMRVNYCLVESKNNKRGAEQHTRNLHFSIRLFDLHALILFTSCLNTK